MKNMKLIYFAPLLILGLSPLACSSNITITPTTPLTRSTATPTITDTPCPSCPPTSTFTVTFTPTASPTAVIPPTITPTPNTTATVPMGLWAVGSFVASIQDLSIYGLATPVTLVVTLFQVSINHNAESTDTATLTTPLDGTIPVTFSTSVNMGSYWVSQYATSQQYNYVVNGTYTMSIATSLGTVTSTMTAPGDITFDATGASVTALYPGNYDAANVARSSPTYANTYASPTGVSIGSPFTFPGSAYSTPSSPATFSSSYSAGATIYTFTGPAAAGSAFFGDETLSKGFTR